MKAIQISSFGDPFEVLDIVDLPEPPPVSAGEVLIGVEYAPLNHNDLLLIAGSFPVHPDLPSIVGNEAIATVLGIGTGVENVKLGDRVIPPLYSFTWRERMVISAAGLVPLPRNVDLQQLAMLRINPPTAALLLSEFADLVPGDWIVQNCANSGVGLAVIAFAKKRGFKTVNIVRRHEQIKAIEAAGGDLVITDDENSVLEAIQLIGNGQVKLALDGISGTAPARLITLLSDNGVLVNYAQMSGEMSAPGDLRPLMRKSITLHNFYQARKEYFSKIPQILQEATELIGSGALQVPVAAIYPITAIYDAIAHTLKGGKVLISMKSPQ